MNKESISIELLKIHDKFKINYNVIITPDTSNPLNKFNPSIKDSKFLTKDDNISIKLYPTEFLVIDIQSKKEKKGISYEFGTFTLNKKNNFFLVLKLKKLFNDIIDKDKEMFYFMDGELKVDRAQADKSKVTFEHNKKYIGFIPEVVVDDKGIRYEGVSVYINDNGCSTTLSINEFQLLINELSTINFSALTTNLINIYFQMNDIDTVSLGINKSQNVVNEIQEQTNPNENAIIVKKDEEVIPNI